MFVDASAIVAILTREPEADALADTIEASRSPVTSPIAVFEAALGVRRKRRSSVEEARADIWEFLELAGVRLVDVTATEAMTALDAMSRYGEGSGHPARLNLGDCFAYAVAKNLGAPLLYKGDDFTRTDIEPAMGTG